MLHRIDYRFHGARYLLVGAKAFGRPPWQGDAGLRHASRQEARSVLAAMAKHEPALFDRLYGALESGGGSARGYASPSWAAEDARVARVQQALGVACVESGEAPTFARLYVLRATDAAGAPSPPESPETRAIDQFLAKLNVVDLAFRGHRYRIARASRLSALSDRDRYETLSESDSLSVLSAWAAEPGSPLGPLLSQLLTLAEEQRAKLGRTELLFLRRTRLHATTTDARPATTPSQLRSARERDWIAIEAVDEDELPIAGVRLDFVLPDGAVTTLTTDAAGVAKIASLAPGNATIRVLDLDGESWRAVGGVAAAPSTHAPARTHVIRAGECLTKVAAKYGFKGWQTLWQHAQNEELRKRRSSPHVLAPGDVVAIPRRSVHEIVRTTGAVHRIELARAKARVRLRLQDLSGNPLAGLRYHYSFQTEERTVRQPGSQQTDANGWLEETVPLSVTQLEIELRLPKLRFAYDLRRLHPARDHDTDLPITSGIAERLHGLGYRATTNAETSTRHGDVALFQSLHLEHDDPSSEPDLQTLDALESAYSV